MLILTTLTAEELHGYAIAERIKLISRDVLEIDEGSLYPALQRMLARGALGAQRFQIVGLFCRRTVLLIIAGLGTGLLGSLWLGRYIRTLLFQVEPNDPIAIVFTAALLAAAAAVATLVPTHRASRVDPAMTLRAE
jgi:hypothetical protein